MAVNAAVSVISVTTRATIGEECAAGTATATACAASRSTVIAGGSARISADDDLEIDIIAGSVAGGGTVLEAVLPPGAPASDAAPLRTALSADLTAVPLPRPADGIGPRDQTLEVPR